MSTIELKEILKSKIDEIEDEFLLEELNTVLKNKSKQSISYNNELQQSELDIENGRIISHSKVLENIKQWKKR